MRPSRKVLPGWLLLALLAAAPAGAAEGDAEIAEELRGLRREVAALRADLSRPGLEEAVAGLGYILGLFGTAAFVASRRKG